MLTNLSVVLGAAGIYGELPFLLFWIAVINELLRLLNTVAETLSCLTLCHKHPITRSIILSVGLRSLELALRTATRGEAYISPELISLLFCAVCMRHLALLIYCAATVPLAVQTAWRQLTLGHHNTASLLPHAPPSDVLVSNAPFTPPSPTRQRVSSRRSA